MLKANTGIKFFFTFCNYFFVVSFIYGSLFAWIFFFLLSIFGFIWLLGWLEFCVLGSPGDGWVCVWFLIFFLLLLVF